MVLGMIRVMSMVFLFVFLEQHKVWISSQKFVRWDDSKWRVCAWSGWCQSNTAVLLRWRNLISQCIFKTITLYLKGRSRTLGMHFFILNLRVSMCHSILMAWDGFFFLALNSGFFQLLAIFSLVLNGVFTGCSWSTFPSSPNNSFSCSKI